jgi:hypothetical protein
MLLSTTGYCNRPITGSLNPLATLIPIISYLNRLVKLTYRYLVIIEQVSKSYCLISYQLVTSSYYVHT